MVETRRFINRKLEDLDLFNVCGGEIDCGLFGVADEVETYPLESSDGTGDWFADRATFFIVVSSVYSDILVLVLVFAD